MEQAYLLYVGVGICVGSTLLGLLIALADLLRVKPTEFCYGRFYSIFALVGSIGYCLASIAFYFSFIKPPSISVFCSLMMLGMITGLVMLAARMPKDSRILFVVLSFYSLVTFYLAPVFLWNLIYVLFIARRPRSRPASQSPTHP